MKPRIKLYSSYETIRYLCHGNKGSLYCCAFGSTMELAYAKWLAFQPTAINSVNTEVMF